MESSASGRLWLETPTRMARSRPEAPRPLGPAGQLLFQGVHQLGEMQVKVGQVVGGDDGPVAAIFGVGQEVGQLHGPRQALRAYGEGRHRVQAQKGQVHEVVLGTGG